MNIAPSPTNVSTASRCLPRVLLWMALSVGLLAIAGCRSEDPHAELLDEMVAALSELDQTLDGITDAASAEAAKPELQAVADRIKALEARKAALPELTTAEEDSLREQYAEPIEAVMAEIAGHVMKLAAQPEIATVIEPIFRDVKPPL